MAEIGLSGLVLDYPHSGSAVYAQNLTRYLPRVAPDLDFRIFLRWARPDRAALTSSHITSPLAPLNRGAGVGARLDKLAWEIGSLPAASALRRQALIHSLYFACPVVAAAPVVVTVHDLIPLALPGYHRTRQSALYSRLMAWAVHRRAAAVITVSNHARDDIVRLLGVPEERVYVTYEAVDERFHPDQPPSEIEAVRGKYRLPDRFVLYLGGSEKRKNLSTLVRAWRDGVQEHRDLGVKLLIVARFPPADPLYPDVPRLVHELGLDGDVVFLDAVDEMDKPAVYVQALAFCFPSIYEGFGFTPLEAMASGVPTLCSNAASLPEVVGDGGRLLEPNDTFLWAEEIARILRSESDREDLRRRGLAQASRFCWHRTAEQTVEVYRAVMGG